ncbi:MAG: hypothetical protein WED33_05510 [Bacteroidia bacterium]
MMKRLSLLSILILCISSCSVKTPEPAAYNDSLAVQQIGITEKANSLHDAFAGYVKAEMEIRRNDLELQLEKAEKAIKRTGKYENDSRLLEAASQFIEGFKKINREEYDEVIRILSKPDSIYTDSDEARLSILYKTIDDQSNKLISTFILAQQEFAQSHEFTLKNDSSAQ